MRIKLLILGGLLATGVVIHHSGHCPLMEMKKALTHHHATPQGATVVPAGVVSR